MIIEATMDHWMPNFSLRGVERYLKYLQKVLEAGAETSEGETYFHLTTKNLFLKVLSGEAIVVRDAPIMQLCLFNSHPTSEYRILKTKVSLEQVSTVVPKPCTEIVQLVRVEMPYLSRLRLAVLARESTYRDEGHEALGLIQDRAMFCPNRIDKGMAAALFAVVQQLLLLSPMLRIVKTLPPESIVICEPSDCPGLPDPLPGTVTFIVVVTVGIDPNLTLLVVAIIVKADTMYSLPLDPKVKAIEYPVTTELQNGSETVEDGIMKEAETEEQFPFRQMAKVPAFRVFAEAQLSASMGNVQLQVLLALMLTVPESQFPPAPGLRTIKLTTAPAQVALRLLLVLQGEYRLYCVKGGG